MKRGETKTWDVGDILVQVSHFDIRGMVVTDHDLIWYDDAKDGVWFPERDYLTGWFWEYPQFNEPGYYVVEGVRGSYTRGDWYEDDDEEWQCSNIRPATEEDMGMMVDNDGT